MHTNLSNCSLLAPQFRFLELLRLLRIVKLVRHYADWYVQNSQAGSAGLRHWLSVLPLPSCCKQGRT